MMVSNGYKVKLCARNDSPYALLDSLLLGELRLRYLRDQRTICCSSLLRGTQCTDVLAEAYKRAKEVVDAGGTNTSSNRKLLHPFRGRTLLFVQITPTNASDAYLQMIERRIERTPRSLPYQLPTSGNAWGVKECNSVFR
ncbi:hypothetical protein Tco_0385425 [Tanacetum coccineum]